MITTMMVLKINLIKFILHVVNRFELLNLFSTRSLFELYPLQQY